MSANQLNNNNNYVSSSLSGFNLGAANNVGLGGGVGVGVGSSCFSSNSNGLLFGAVPTPGVGGMGYMNAGGATTNTTNNNIILQTLKRRANKTSVPLDERVISFSFLLIVVFSSNSETCKIKLNLGDTRTSTRLHDHIEHATHSKPRWHNRLPGRLCDRPLRSEPSESRVHHKSGAQDPNHVRLLARRQANRHGRERPHAQGARVGRAREGASGRDVRSQFLHRFRLLLDVRIIVQLARLDRQRARRGDQRVEYSHPVQGGHQQDLEQSERSRVRTRRILFCHGRSSTRQVLVLDHLGSHGDRATKR